MDCDKYDPLLLDELYEELDEVTSAAVKRHCAGCARCASTLNDLRATRRAAVVPVVELPDGLEDRILAAAKEAQKVVPIRSRLSGALSQAGRWAMRPQTAMAAVFLLMIGSSAFVLRAKKDAASAAAVSVTEHGAPEPTAAASAQTASLDIAAAAAAHGAAKPGHLAPPPPAAPTAAAPAMAANAYGEADEERRVRRAKGSPADLALGEDPEGKKAESLALGGKPSAPAPASDEGPAPSSGAAPGAANASPRAEAQDGFSAGMASYRARNFADATRHFDRAAETGDSSSALWAAKSVKEGRGCAAALARFDSVSQRASGSWIGHEAELEAARCQAAMGQSAAARERLGKLALVPSHAEQARSTLAALDQVAKAQQQGGGAVGGAAGARPATRAPQKAAVEKAPATTAPGF